MQGCVYTAQCGGVCRKGAVTESLVSSLLWKWVCIDYSPASTLVGAKWCTSASFCPFLVSEWRLWCFLLLLCCDMGRWHKFMDKICAWPCSKWPCGFFRIGRFWCCLVQLIGFTDSLWIQWSHALYFFTRGICMSVRAVMSLFYIDSLWQP